MFLELSHTKLNIFSEMQDLAIECYQVTKSFPADEKFSRVQQLRRAAVSVHLNMAEGCPGSQKQKGSGSSKFQGDLLLKWMLPSVLHLNYLIAI